MVQQYQDENKEDAYRIAAFLLTGPNLCDPLRANALMMLSTEQDHPRRLNLSMEACRVLDEHHRKAIIENGDSIDECFPHAQFAHAKVLLDEARRADAAMYPELAPGEPIVLECHIEKQYQPIENPGNDDEQGSVAAGKTEADLKETNIELSQEGLSAEKESGDDGQSTVHLSNVVLRRASEHLDWTSSRIGCNTAVYTVGITS